MQLVISFLVAHGAQILGCLLALSEYLGWSKKIQANSVGQLIWNLIAAKAEPVTIEPPKV